MNTSTNDEIEVVEIAQQTIEHKGRKFQYAFTNLEIEQAELCREVGELKSHQIQQPAQSINELIKSQGAEYFTIIASYLFKEIIAGEPTAFNRTKSETDFIKFFKALPISEYAKVEVAIRDFFTNIGREQIGSLLFQREKKRSEIETLDLLAKLMTLKPNSETNDTQEN